MTATRSCRYVLGILFAVYFVHMMDRSVLLVLLEEIRVEFALTDSRIALLSGIGYALPFALAGLPLGVLADRVNRKRLLCVLILIWSTFTALAGTARNFVLLLATRAVSARPSPGRLRRSCRWSPTCFRSPRAPAP